MSKLQSKDSFLVRHPFLRFLTDSVPYDNKGIEAKSFPEEYIFLVDVPGIPKDHLTLEIHESYLTVAGEYRNCMAASESEKENRFCLDRNVSQHFTLPVDSNVNDIQAHYKDGVLLVSVARMQKMGKSIKVGDYREKWSDRVKAATERIKESLHM